MTKSVRQLVFCALFCAVSIVLVWLIHFPLIPAAPFLEYDPADIPILIAAFAFGPVAGLITTLVTCIVQGLTVSATSGPYGILMHLIATGTFVAVAGFIYKAKKTRKSAIIALAAGTLAMTAIMIPANLIVIPIFMGAPRQAVLEMILPAILPFNLAKAAINSLITFALYKSLSRLISGVGEKRAVN